MATPMTDANVAQWLGEGDHEAESAARACAEALIDPIQTNEARLKLGIDIEWQLSVIKEWVLDKESPMSSRIKAMRLMREVLRDCGMSSNDLRTKFGLQQWIADAMRHRSVRIVDSHVDNDESKPKEIPPDIQAATDKLNEIVTVDVTP